jgi:tetratricopeptide (TPR) repeat protein
MNITELIQHPEHMDRDTLYDLRSLLALYPYYQTARLLMLQNLYLLHDPSFDDELRRAAIYITDRRVLFQMIEAAHYQLRPSPSKNAVKTVNANTSAPSSSRTISLIDSFLESIPKEGEDKVEDKKKRKPTPADAAVDYVAYLLETEGEQEAEAIPEMKRQDLIDTFINSDKGRIKLSEEPEYTPQLPETTENSENVTDEGYFTETLARIYIKQGRYSKALEIIRRLSLVYPKKNAYFADQIRFLEKLIINNNKK